MESINKINVWMPLQKGHDGKFVAILSDNSIDRDGEFMSKGLLKSWVDDSISLPMLANHENKLEKLIGGWTNKKLITNKGHTAMTAEPFFLESNPLGKQAKAMVEEALSKGLNIGISIGAIPSGGMISKEIDGKTYKGYTKAEILEATIVPIQSNRNASFSAVAKSFNIHTKSLEETKMTEQEIKKEEVAPEAAPAGAEVKPEAASSSEEVPESESKPEEVKEEEEEEESKEVSADKSRIADLEKEIAEMKQKAVLKATVDGPIIKQERKVDTSLVGLFKMQYGGQ